MDSIVLAIGAFLAVILYVFFHSEIAFLYHSARSHWTLPRLLRSSVPVVDMLVAVMGGLVIVGFVHVRSTQRARRLADTARRRAAARAGVASGKVRSAKAAAAAAPAGEVGAAEVAYRAPAPHFGTGANQCGAAGAHRAHDAADDPRGRLGPRDAAVFESRGYVVVRGLLGAADLCAARAEMDRVVDAWPTDGRAADGDAPETPLVAFDAGYLRGALGAAAKKRDGVRRLFRLAKHVPYFARLARDARFVDVLTALWGPDVALLQSMALVKPPGTGEKRWHQDQGYFRLRPSKVAAYWIAIDAADARNGCMHVVPGSHRRGVDPHGVDVGVPPDHPDYRRYNLGGVYYSALSPPPPAAVVAVPMAPGDALLFHGDLMHATPPNASADRRRFALQLHYASAECRPTRCPRGGRPAENAVYGPDDAGFDCAPEAGGEICTEPQFWYYRRAELAAAGTRRSGCI